MKIKISQFYFRSSKECPGYYRGFAAPKTKFLHVSLSLLSPPVRPWSVILCLTPVIPLSLGLPFFSSICFFFYVFLRAILFMCPNCRIRYPQLLQIYYSMHP